MGVGQRMQVIRRKNAGSCRLRRGILLALILGASINQSKGFHMLFTIALILLILWVLGFISSYTLGGYIHILLILAVVFLVVGLFQRNGRNS